jgi:hypothetical protein
MKNNYCLNSEIDVFVNCFTTLNPKGFVYVLKEDVVYDELSKQYWIALFEERFESFKQENIPFLKPIPGRCVGCKKGCSGFTFLDKESGFYVDLAIETDGTAIVEFTDCVNLKNDVLGLNKDLHFTTQEFPF